MGDNAGPSAHGSGRLARPPYRAFRLARKVGGDGGLGRSSSIGPRGQRWGMRFGGIALALVAAMLCAPNVAAAERPAADRRSHKRPNIVYILADDMGYGDVSAFNERCAWRTPHMDRLATEGMMFTDAHSGSAVCTPTRYGILTGRYAWRTRLKRGVLGGDSRHLIDPGRLTVASLLKQYGYHTACIGKWHLGWDFARVDGPGSAIDYTRPVANGPWVNGFDYAYCHNGSLDMPPYVYVENGRVTAPPDRITEGADYQAFWRKGPTGADFHHADVLPRFTRLAVDYIHARARAATPFFLYFALPAPHTPILPTKAFRGKSGTNAYGDFVLQVDDTIGQVLAALDETALAENTLVIVTSDNGCSPRADFEALARFGHRPSYVFRGYKADIYEGGHRVPFLVRWPARVEAGTRCTETICLTDLMRTCADLLGVTLPASAGEDSVSFYRLLVGRSSSHRPDDAAGGGADEDRSSGRVPNGRGLAKPLRDATVHHSINGSFAIRSGKWKLALCPGSGGWSPPRPREARRQGLPLLQLYDLAKDVGERHNVAADHRRRVVDLIDRLEDIVDRGRSTPGKARPNEGSTPFLPKGFSRQAWEEAAIGHGR